MSANRLRLIAMAAVLAGAVAMAGCRMTVPPGDPVYTRIGELQHQVDRLQKLVKGQQFMGVVSTQQQIQQRIQALNGKIQTLHHRIERLRQRQQSINQNFDRRLSRLGGGAPAGFGARGAGATRGTGRAAAGGTAGAPARGSGGLGGVAQGAGGVHKVADHAAYRAAFDKLRSNHYAAAVSAFKSFVEKYPDSGYVPNALYWMAETRYVNGEYHKALKNFRKVINSYPGSKHAADAFLKIGYVQYALGQYDKARSTFKAVIRKYPGSTSADLAKQRLRKMGVRG